MRGLMMLEDSIRAGLLPGCLLVLLLLASGFLPRPSHVEAFDNIRSIPLYIEEIDGVDREGVFASSGIPFPVGMVRSVDELGLFDQNGSRIPCQFGVLATWPDNSLRWVLVTLDVTVMANSLNTYSLKVLDTHENAKATLESSVIVDQDDREVLVDTGKLRFRISKTNGRV
jgi:hypothetical protein